MTGDYDEMGLLKATAYSEGLDPLLMLPVRLLITTMLADMRWRDYSTIWTTFRMTPNALSGQLRTLRREGYMETRRDGPHSRWRLTTHGQERLADHLDALRNIMTRAGELLPATAVSELRVSSETSVPRARRIVGAQEKEDC